MLGQSRARVAAFLELPRVSNFIVGVIIFNSIVLGLETSAPIMDRAGPLILALDAACLAIFCVEIAAKLYAYGLRFFRSGWNVFDLVIVAIALVPAAGAFSVLRAMRILRLLRLLSAAPRLRRVIEAFLNALPSMGSVFLLIAMMFYIGSVMATKLFGAAFPDWFGTLGGSAYSLFQIMTLESWSMGIVRPVMEEFPFAWAFFVPFILLTTFTALNLIVGLIVNSLQDAHSEEEVAEREAYQDAVLERLSAIEARLSKD